MNKLYFVKAGGRRGLDFGALHRRPRYEGRDERGPGRRLEGNSERSIERLDHVHSISGRLCYCKLRRRGLHRGICWRDNFRRGVGAVGGRANYHNGRGVPVALAVYGVWLIPEVSA